MKLILFYSICGLLWNKDLSERSYDATKGLEYAVQISVSRPGALRLQLP